MDDTFAWTIAAGPIVMLLLAAVLTAAIPRASGVFVTLIMIVFNTVFALQDRRRVMAAGYAGISAFWGFLFMPAYMVMRGRQVGNWAIPLAYGFAVLVYLAALAVVS